MSSASMLADLPLFRGFDDDEIDRIALAGRVERWSSGSLVMEEGDAGPRLIVILEGRVAVLKSDGAGGEHVLSEVAAGSVLGEMSLLTGAPRNASVRAVDSLRVFAMDRTVFDGMVADGDPAAMKLSLAIARVLAHRLEQLNHRLVELLEEEEGDSPLHELSRFRQELFSRWDF